MMINFLVIKIASLAIARYYYFIFMIYQAIYKELLVVIYLKKKNSNI